MASPTGGVGITPRDRGGHIAAPPSHHALQIRCKSAMSRGESLERQRGASDLVPNLETSISRSFLNHFGRSLAHWKARRELYSARLLRGPRAFSGQTAASIFWRRSCLKRSCCEEFGGMMGA